MEEAPENGKESPHSVHANGLIDMSMEEGHELSKCYAHNLRQ